MSELASFVRQVDQVWNEWEEINGRILSAPFPRNATEVTSDFRKLIDLTKKTESTLLPVKEKLTTKLNQIDPVTGQKRYGPSSATKLASAKDRLAQLQLNLQQSLVVLEPLAQDAVPCIVSLPAPPPLIEEIVIAGRKTFVHVDTDEGKVLQEELQDHKPADLLSDEEIRLHEEAEAIRVKNQVERSRLQLLDHEVRRSLESICCILAQTSYCTERIEAACECLATACKACGQNPKDSLGLVLNILERVLGRPDDVQARRIRLLHPIIWAKLGSRKGGLSLLTALGFTPRVVAPLHLSGMSTAEDATEELRLHGVLVASQQQIVTALSALREASLDAVNMDWAHLPFLLAPHTSCDLVLEMDEPPIEGDGVVVLSKVEKMSWLQWFDGLKSHKELVAGFV